MFLCVQCRDVRTREVGIQEIHHKVRPYQVMDSILETKYGVVLLKTLITKQKASIYQKACGFFFVQPPQTLTKMSVCSGGAGAEGLCG